MGELSARYIWMHRSHATDLRMKLLPRSLLGESHSLESQIYTRTPIMYLDIFKMSTDLGHETQAKVHHTLLLFKNSTSTVRIQAKDEAASFVMKAEVLMTEPVVQIGPLR
ncbi:hypothetical protein K457DRAFT_1880740 [Linnemannia elongata AG-77]|uniref:Uncharacterized protein n=1 Tax=Linnemannia elongata AG-77 TaxID=1314771 RepID=A0A197JIN4_9FUNG|nr:hypothetical protein K457DRAFT_1880740 [Linnemannia elongata AG-77]